VTRASRGRAVASVLAVVLLAAVQPAWTVAPGAQRTGLADPQEDCLKLIPPDIDPELRADLREGCRLAAEASAKDDDMAPLWLVLLVIVAIVGAALAICAYHLWRRF
jgi:hypothetical protein